MRRFYECCKNVKCSTKYDFDFNKNARKLRNSFNSFNYFWDPLFLSNFCKNTTKCLEKKNF